MPRKTSMENEEKRGGGGGGILDFNNMTEDHIKEIAAKADQLIEIIQNIKDKVGGGGSG